MRNGGESWSLLSLSLCMLLSTSVSAEDDNSDVLCPDNCTCGLGPGYVNCSDILIYQDKFGSLKIKCNGSRLDGLKLPKNRNIATSRQLYKTIISNCTVNSPLQSVIPDYNKLMFLTLLNPLTPLDEDTLRGLVMLNRLNIYNYGVEKLCNETDVLPRGTFQDTRLLKELNVLNYCNELRLDEGVISSLADLQRLYLVSITKLVLGSKALSNLPSLWLVTLTECNITELPEDVFSGSNNIKFLYLSNNELTNLPEKVFYNMRKLQTLRLSNNILEKVTKGTFESLTELTKLYLDGNRIVTLSNCLFTLKKLEILSLAKNSIENITTDLSSTIQVDALKSLDLSHNMLSWKCMEYEESSLFNYLYLWKSVDQLDLSYNRIQSVCEDWKHVVKQSLDLSYNRLESLTKDDLAFESNQVRVNFNNNHITTVIPLSISASSTAVFNLGSNPFNCDCHLYSLLSSVNHHYNLKGAQCSQPPSLKNVSLKDLTNSTEWDKLTCSVEGFGSCKCLILPNQKRFECDCEDTKNITLPKTKFDTNISVMKLKLSKLQQNLTRLPSFVTELDLSGLELNSIPEISNSVGAVDLSNNCLQMIPSEIYNRNYSLYLENNPLRCDCSHKDSVENLKNHWQKILDYDKLLCSDGLVVKGRDPTTLCDTRNAIVVGVSCSAGAVILAIAIVLMYKYLPEVQVLLFHIGLRCIVKEEWIDKGKTYDIFLSYNYKDEHFARDILLPKLEEMNYKVCDYNRDWDLGQQITEQIYTSVANSKKTLFVMSENFMKSVWVLEEFNATILQGAKDRMNRAVVILLENVNLDKAPIAIKCHITLNTYIMWDATDNSFWTKLQNALPKKLTAEEIRKRQKAVRAVKSLGTGSSLVLNEDGRLVNPGLQRAMSTSSATSDIVDLETLQQSM